jgi:hypothetical protein
VSAQSSKRSPLAVQGRRFWSARTSLQLRTVSRTPLWSSLSCRVLRAREGHVRDANRVTFGVQGSGYPHVFSFEEYRQLLIIELPTSKFFSPPSLDVKTEKPAGCARLAFGIYRLAPKSAAPVIRLRYSKNTSTSHTADRAMDFFRSEGKFFQSAGSFVRVPHPLLPESARLVDCRLHLATQLPTQRRRGDGSRIYEEVPNSVS